MPYNYETVIFMEVDIDSIYCIPITETALIYVIRILIKRFLYI